MAEAWLRGPVPGIPDGLLPAAHCFIDAVEELKGAARDFGPLKLWVEPFGVASLGFHLRHVSGSTQRLLTYAMGGALTPDQLSAIQMEANPGTPPAGAGELIEGLEAVLATVLDTFRSTSATSLSESRFVGRDKLPSTVRGLFFHAAEHARRHAGQALVTARVVRSLPSELHKAGPLTLADVRHHWVEGATRAYEEAGMRGLCQEGRFEYAIDPRSNDPDPSSKE